MSRWSCFLFLPLALLLNAQGCQPSTERMEDFWPVFQKAVKKDDLSAVADLTHFPFLGAEPFIDSDVYLADGIIRPQFILNYHRIFDPKVQAVIARTRLESLQRYMVEEDSYANLMGVPAGTEAYRLDVTYVYNEGTENQTESTISFNFAPYPEGYRLSFLLMGG